MSVTSILKSIGGFLKSLLPWTKKAIAVGRDVATELKEIVDNPAWDVVTSLTSTKLDDAGLTLLRTFLGELVKDLGLADPNISRGDAIGVVFKQASTSISLMELPEAKAGTLNTISAAIATKYAEIKGNVLPIETALAAAQPAYLHPELVA